MFYQKSKKELPVESKKPKKKMSRWHYAKSHYEDQEEKERLRDVDYKHWKLNNF